MIDELGRAWESSKQLFFRSRIEGAFNDGLSHSNLRLGLVVFAFATVLTSIIAFTGTAAVAYFGLYQENIKAEITESAAVAFDFGQLMPFGLFHLLFIIPFSIAFSLAYEGIIYQAFRLMKGKATFAQQYYLSSLVALSLAMAATVTLLLALPCINLFAGLAYILISAYFLLHVNSKAYGIAHGLPYAPVLAVVLVLAIPRILIMAFVMQEASSIFGIPDSFEFSGVEHV